MKAKNKLINKDGSFNVKRVGLPSHFFDDFYHTLMEMSWLQYIIFFILGYLGVNCIFASLYYLGGNNILNASPGSFWDAWLFSFQTSTTVGYGHYLPKTTFANIVVIFDALSGILFVALATGMAFSKFSRPTSRVVFTDKMIITTYNGFKTLMFRLGNARSSSIVDAEVSAVAIILETSSEGIEMRRIRDVKLERNRTPIFGISLTAMHIIDERSPIYGLSLEDIRNKEVAFVISFTGIEDAFSQTVHARKTYTSEEVIEAKKFEDLLYLNAEGQRIMDYNKFHQIIES